MPLKLSSPTLNTLEVSLVLNLVTNGHTITLLLSNPKQKCEQDLSQREPPMKCDGGTDFYAMPVLGTDADYYEQARFFLTKVIDDKQKENLCKNLGSSLGNVEEEVVVQEMIKHYGKVDEAFGKRVEECRQEAIKNPRESEKVVTEKMKELEKAKAKETQGGEELRSLLKTFM